MRLIRAFGHLFAVPFVILFIVVLPLTLWVFTLQQAAFNRSIYERIIENDDLYTTALPFLITEAAFPSDEEGLSPGSVYIRQALDDLTDDEWQQVAELLAPTVWIRGQTQENLDATLAWVDNDSIRPEVEFELETLREALYSQQAQGLAQLLVDAQPPCTEAEARQIAETIADEANERIPQCQPEADGGDSLVAHLVIVLTDTAERLPESIPSQAEMSRTLTADEQQRILNLKANIRIVRRLALIVFVLPVALLLIVQIITVRTPKTFFSWYGWSMLLGGMVTLGSTIDAFPLLVLRLYTAEPVQSETAVFVSTLFSQLTEPVLLSGAAITVFGLLFVLLGFVLKSPEG